MILSIVLILFVGLIAYLHYVQGLLNGLISVVLAVVAAMLALSFYEPVADSMSGGQVQRPVARASADRDLRRRLHGRPGDLRQG